MNFIYNTGIRVAHFFLKCIAPFHPKIKQGVLGRAETFNVLKSKLTPTTRTLWFHCASLGEYEQGLPVFEALRLHYPTHIIVLSFFSPSGYTIRKHTPVADVVVYLPLDTKANAQRFLTLVHPELSIFVKYDIWPNYLNAISTSTTKALLISAAFRKEQLYFKWYGTLFKRAVFAFDHIFTQNENSKALLATIGYPHVTVSGDTRYDRVSNQLQHDNTIDVIATFKNEHLCIVVGSSWPEDDALFIHFINTYATPDLKIIIAPHTIKSQDILHLKSKLNTKVLLYSERHGKALEQYSVLIVDTIGLLSKIYSYADIAYVGGAMGTTGLHNTLEPAVFGIPIIIGPHHKKYPEAQALIAHGGLFSVANQNAFDTILKQFIAQSDFRKQCGSKNAEYVDKNKGAVIQILDYLRI